LAYNFIYAATAAQQIQQQLQNGNMRSTFKKSSTEWARRLSNDDRGQTDHTMVEAVITTYCYLLGEITQMVQFRNKLQKWYQFRNKLQKWYQSYATFHVSVVLVLFL
jgi:hypothetical protein